MKQHWNFSQFLIAEWEQRFPEAVHKLRLKGELQRRADTEASACAERMCDLVDSGMSAFEALNVVLESVSAKELRDAA